MSLVAEKSFQLSIRIVNSYKYLSDQKNEFIMSKQLLRSGTSIGANISEAEFAQSKSDFIHKLSISLKETNESIYWIRLLHATSYLTNIMYSSLLNDLKDIKHILMKIINTSKSKT
ncbi:four helix bundle protein [Flammeovirga yaeyamensis]|uniref:Four helix bundle protein n=1 Tax=Flammeovirga yaeyamensis TaxID=367791 RepID=A0AAX1N9T2_9BACT|nr:four helix bundle protein [Flammeovirga yaeyamensis]MBB3699397.1 four helix bundle protein [Flammeovirga yaeyamensis]NMF35344.1 four helix bundle protein [Flammeovirga yaeyamensis]QWG04204.1 four helix bundle protein [Flammeovirga yaeyamensis]